MGDVSPDLQVGTQGPEREIKVLVTGYGPFHARFPINSSWEIARTLPDSLPATATCPAIKLITPSRPIDVVYDTVVNWCEQRLAENDYDIVVHIGLAAGREYFTLERQSMRTPYWEKKDVEGAVFSKIETELLWPAGEFPEILKPTFDCNDVWLRWRSNVTNPLLDVRPSDDPGNYLCGFIYYCSMAWFWRRQARERPVVFLHTPDLPTEPQLAGGREVTIGLVRALVESWIKNGPCDPLTGEGLDVQRIDIPMGAAEIPIKPSDAPAAAEDDMAWSYKR